MQAVASGWSRLRVVLPYGLAVVATVGAMLLRLSLGQLLGEQAPMLVFTLAVFVSGYVGGVGPGLLATGLSIVAANYYFIPPYDSFKVFNTADQVRVLIFLSIGILTSLLCESQRRSARLVRAGERALGESEERFSLLVAQVKEYAIILLDPSGRIMSWNAGAQRIKGYAAEEIIGRHFTCFYAPEDLGQSKPERELEQAATQGQYVEEGWRVRNDGSRFWATVTLTALRDDAGRLRGYAKVTRDITSRKNNEAELRRVVAELEQANRELLFQKFTIDQHAIVAMTDAKGRITYANDKFCQISQYSREELLGQDHRLINSGYHSKEFFRQMYATITRGRVWQGEVRNRAKDGSHYWVDSTIVPFTDASGRVSRYVVVRADITERKRAEEAAAEASRAKDHFIAVLSHELRTPLTPILAAVDLIEAQAELPEDLRHELRAIRHNAEHETRLVDDLLNLTRLKRGKLELHQEVVDICLLLRNAVEQFRTELGAKHLQADLVIEARDCHVWADPGRLQQVLANLLANAVKFTPENGRITVRCTNPQARRLRVEVSDTGMGIEAEVLPRLFNAFEQGQRIVTRSHGGLGLGLAISKAIMDLHGGTLEASSEGKDRGATFALELETVTAPIQQRPEPAEMRRCDGPRRILLVEDNPDTLRIMAKLLRSFGHTVHTAGGVQEAMDAAGQQSVDLVISDIGLPDGSGLDLMRQLRERDLARGIAISGYGTDEDIRRSREAGFAEHLTKPVDIGRLEAAIAEVAGETGKA